MQSIGGGRTSSQQSPKNRRSHNTAERINCISKVLHVAPTTQLKVHCAQRGAWRPMLWCDVFGLLRSGRRDDADRRTFQPRCYGPAHTGTERLVHGKVTSAVRFV
jgi:hypothetical protein